MLGRLFRFLRPLPLLCCLVLLCSCASNYRPAVENHFPAEAGDPIAELLQEAPLGGPKSAAPLEKMGFSVQVGAFSSLDNAVRFETILDRRGLDAYYFLHETGLYKVRFGNHSTYQAAREQAERLRDQGLIGSFFIVIPENYAVAEIQRSGKGSLRHELVRTAKRFLGVPYRWGGEDRQNGFDCSGLTMVSYRLNGLNLPRNSRMQYRTGHGIKKKHLRQGDLVFFATKGGKRVTHVGMYVGSGQFIHAPRTGKTVRIASLSSPFWRRTYVGARTYL